MQGSGVTRAAFKWFSVFAAKNREFCTLEKFPLTDSWCLLIAAVAAASMFMAVSMIPAGVAFSMIPAGVAFAVAMIVTGTSRIFVRYQFAVQ